MRLIIDNSLSWGLARDLERGGQDALHVEKRNMYAAEDEDTFKYAGGAQRFIITEDTDYEKLIERYQTIQPSVILLRISEARPSRQATMLLTVLPTLEPDLEA